MKKLFYKLVLWYGGWTVINEVPTDLKKCITIGAPHTSNWDFVYALPGLEELKIYRFRYLIKKEFFFWPFSWLFNATGGIAVDRSKRNDLTNYLKELIEKEEEIYLLFPPEGTRSKVERWKTGFYYTALETNLPIILAFLDYEKRVMGFGKVLYPTGDFNKDFTVIQDFYKDKKGKNPKNYNPQIFIPKEEQ
ncbi:MAG: glycerol acyltransferase [Crocinitomicaceae bacterium]|nr:glycerol acyltransferase [Crocinitomicaceae bacterium]